MSRVYRACLLWSLTQSSFCSYGFGMEFRVWGLWSSCVRFGNPERILILKPQRGSQTLDSSKNCRIAAQGSEGSGLRPFSTRSTNPRPLDPEDFQGLSLHLRALQGVGVLRALACVAVSPKPEPLFRCSEYVQARSPRPLNPKP